MDSIQEEPQDFSNLPFKVYSKDKKKFIQIPTDNSALMDEIHASAFLSLTRRALQNFRVTGGGPEYIRISSRCIRYRKSDLIAWYEERVRKSTSE